MHGHFDEPFEFEYETAHKSSTRLKMKQTGHFCFTPLRGRSRPPGDYGPLTRLCLIDPRDPGERVRCLIGLLGEDVRVDRAGDHRILVTEPVRHDMERLPCG